MPRRRTCRTLESDQAKNSVGGRKLKGGPVHQGGVVHQGGLDHQGGPVHQALAARRSREFNRADTDLLPASVTLEYDEEEEEPNS